MSITQDGSAGQVLALVGKRTRIWRDASSTHAIVTGPSWRSGRLEAGGLLLFALLFLWQIPHFLAIGLYRAAEYKAAGMVIHANSLGPVATRRRIAAWTVLLVAATGLLVPLGVGGWLTGAAAALLGLGFLTRTLVGLRPGADDVWARGLFRYSLVYLTGLFAVLAVDHLLG